MLRDDHPEHRTGWFTVIATFRTLFRAATRLTRTQKRLSKTAKALQRALSTTPMPVMVPKRTTARPGHDEPAPAVPSARDEFIDGTHWRSSQVRGYKLYVPPDHGGRPLPLVVMLHGCSQDPDDFAAGTAMNDQARDLGFFVLYPAQSKDANPSRCWNWFKHAHQQRGRGEPALIADMTLVVMNRYDVDTSRVYIAGLSAGGAMAAIVAAAYPEIFAAVGVHSGLPRGAARDMVEALAVMKGGVADPSPDGQPNSFGTRIALPTIVFHGDQDEVVHPRNSEQVIAAALRERDGVAGSSSTFAASRPKVERGVSASGRRYTRSTHHDHRGNAFAEHWLVHGAGHAWFGGRTTGSHTDAAGPDATREMLRFFFGQPHEPVR